MTAKTLVQVHVSSLELCVHRDGPGNRENEQPHTHITKNYNTTNITTTTGEGSLLGALRVPDHQVSIGPRDDPALAGVQVIDLGSVGAGHSYKLVLVHFASNLR